VGGAPPERRQAEMILTLSFEHWLILTAFGLWLIVVFMGFTAWALLDLRNEFGRAVNMLERLFYRRE
jgi:hypothetical protein